MSDTLCSDLPLLTVRLPWALGAENSTVGFAHQKPGAPHFIFCWKDVLSESQRSTLPGSSTHEKCKERQMDLSGSFPARQSQQAHRSLDQPVKYSIAKCFPHFYKLQTIPILLHPMETVLVHLSDQIKTCAVLGWTKSWAWEDTQAAGRRVRMGTHL